MAVWQRQGAVHVQDVVLCAQEALQVLRVRGHLLGHGVHTLPADQSLHEQQRHALVLTVHHRLQKPGQRGGRRLVSDTRSKNSEVLLQSKLQIFFQCVHVYDGEAAATRAKSAELKRLTICQATEI